MPEIGINWDWVRIEFFIKRGHILKWREIFLIIEKQYDSLSVYLLHNIKRNEMHLWIYYIYDKFKYQEHYDIIVRVYIKKHIMYVLHYFSKFEKNCIIPSKYKTSKNHFDWRVTYTNWNVYIDTL